MSAGFSVADSTGGGTSVADTMCDLLAYHDLLEAQIPEEMNETSSTTENTADSPITDVTLENLLALIKLNVNDTCAWVSEMTFT